MKRAAVAQLRLGGEVALRSLNVLHTELAVVAHGDQLIDRHDALMADDAPKWRTSGQ